LARAATTALVLILALPLADALAQKRPPSLREFLLQYKGRELQIVDKTGGNEQFATGDPSKTYTLVLNDVQNDYIIVSRNTPTDKRTFVYPLAIIRRVIFQFDGKPYEKILLEMY
jgi:hypothetical protein